MDSIAKWRRQSKESMNLQKEQQKIDWKKFNGISGTSGTITEALTFVSYKHPRKGGEKRWD